MKRILVMAAPLMLGACAASKRSDNVAQTYARDYLDNVEVVPKGEKKYSRHTRRAFGVQQDRSTFYVYEVTDDVGHTVEFSVICVRRDYCSISFYGNPFNLPTPTYRLLASGDWIEGK